MLFPIPTHDQIAYLFTKGLSPIFFIFFLILLFLSLDELKFFDNYLVRGRVLEQSKLRPYLGWFSAFMF